ncbi:unnamed protein product [Schistosoma margrebowiei]|uniref:Protein-tyrosine-phosphatase n=1 Tax=Schistosoma margrebowiei TaxID=48269 RepID=A0AA85AGJ5_9TREM|nr:unnamed protein product [Schistosoma margrebowiei]
MSIIWHIFLILFVSNPYCESSFNVALSASDPVGSTYNQSFTYGVTSTPPDASTNFSITATATTNFTTTTDGFNQSKFCHHSKLLPPENVTITNVTSDSFDINWNLPRLYSRLNKVIYEILINSPQRLPIIIKNVSSCLQSKERIINLTSCWFYIIQIKTHDMLLMKSSDWSNPVFTTTLLPQHVVQSHFEVENMSPTIQKVKWSKFTVPNECMALIQLLQINEKTFIELITSVAINETEYTFYNLAPSTQYTYQLKVISPFGNYLGQYISITTKTLPLIHLLNTSIHTPKLIQISNITSTSFVIIWSVMKTNGSQFKTSTYEILLNSQRQSLLLIKNISSELFREKIENLTACTIYTIQMRLVVKLSETVYSEWSNPLTAFTSISNISKKTLIKITNLGRNMQHLRWIKLNDPILMNKCKSYLELVQCSHLSYKCMTVELSVNETTFIYYNLKPLTTYTYSINLISPFGNINDIYMKSTAETLPNGPNTPVNLSISHISPNKLTLHWQNPPQHPAFDVHCFLVYKRESIHLMSGLDEYRICDVSNELILTSLIPGRQYTLYMRSEDSVYGLHSDMSNAISATTYPSQPNAPTNLTVTNISSNQFTIKWTEPVQDSAFIIKYYLIYYRPTLKINDLFTQTHIFSNHCNEYIITSLLPGINYTVYMKSIDSIYGIYSNESIPMTVYTFPDAPNPPINVTFIETGSTQLRVVWMPPEENLAFNINCYLVYIRPTFTVFSHFQKFNICHSYVCDIKSLLPGVNYTVYVESFDLTYGLRSLPSNYITAVTYPDRPIKPENVTVTNIKPNQFTIRWNEIKHDLTFTNICYSLYVRPTLNINDNFNQFNVCNGKSEFTVTFLLPKTNYTVYLKSFDTNYGIYSDATKSFLIYTTYPACIQPPVNLTFSEINIYGFTVHWDHALEDHSFDNNNYYYVFIKALHNHTNKPMKFNAGQSATSFHIFSLSPDTWYSVSVQCIDTTYHNSIESEEIFVHTYSETVERDSLNQLTSLILQVPPEQQTTHIQQDNMIILYLPLSQLNCFISTVYVVSLVIKPTRENHDDEIICSEGCTKKMHYNDITDIYLVESTYKNRHNKENGSWEILIHSRLELSQTRTRRSMAYRMNESYLYSDKYFIIGENGVCPYNSHECNGPLKPATQYSIQLRTYTEYGYTTSKIIHGRTLSDTTVILITCCILWSLFILAISSFGLLYYRLIERSTIPKINDIYNNIARGKINNKSIINEDIYSQKIMDRTHLPNLCTSMKWPTPVTTNTFMAQYENYSKDSFATLKVQYQLIISNSQFLIQSDMLSQEIGQKNINKRLNRFSDILPYDQTRVKLNPLQKSKQEHDYVNASFIYEIIPCTSVHTHPVLNRNKIEYIASQAPLESTVGDFWRMILDQNITIIVMLTKLYEDNISKCCQYWPNDIHESLTFQSDCLRLEVTLLSEEDHHIYILRKLYITSINYQSNNPENSKYVVQLHMTTWPDFDVPNLSEFQTFMKDYRELKCAESHRYSPTLVHCTAGVGRTGTFIVADLLQIYKESNCVYYDIPGIILQMRRCRPSMVQKVAQYIFLHQFANTLFQRY